MREVSGCPWTVNPRFWYRRAAIQGVHEAYRHLGMLYAAGRSVERDNAKALFWLSLVPENPEVEAVRRFVRERGGPAATEAAQKICAKNGIRSDADAAFKSAARFEMHNSVSKPECLLRGHAGRLLEGRRRRLCRRTFTCCQGLRCAACDAGRSGFRSPVRLRSEPTELGMRSPGNSGPG